MSGDSFSPVPPEPRESTEPPPQSLPSPRICEPRHYKLEQGRLASAFTAGVGLVNGAARLQVKGGGASATYIEHTEATGGAGVVVNADAQAAVVVGRDARGGRAADACVWAGCSCG